MPILASCHPDLPQRDPASLESERHSRLQTLRYYQYQGFCVIHVCGGGGERGDSEGGGGKSASCLTYPLSSR